MKDIVNTINNLIDKRLYILADIAMEMYINNDINNNFFNLIYKLNNIQYVYKIASSSVNDGKVKENLIWARNNIIDDIINELIYDEKYKYIIESYINILCNDIYKSAQKNKYISKFDYFILENEENKDKDIKDNKKSNDNKKLKEKSKKIEDEYNKFLNKNNRELSHGIPTRDFFSYYQLYPYIYPIVDIPEYGYWYTYII